MGNLPQLAICWRELALGKPIWKGAVASGPSEEESSALFQTMIGGVSLLQSEDAASAHALIYGPDNNNEELIESVLLRNASYPGHWDASKESVWKILPAGDSSKDSKNTAAATIAGFADGGVFGDDHWLSQLRDSVAIETSAAEKASTSTPNRADTSKNTNPANAMKSPEGVSTFFESLLKK